VEPELDTVGVASAEEIVLEYVSVITRPERVKVLVQQSDDEADVSGVSVLLRSVVVAEEADGAVVSIVDGVS